MLPVFYAFLRSNSRFIVFPAALMLGAVGYYVENLVSSKYTPPTEAITKQRSDRLASDLENRSLNLKRQDYENVLDKNLSPSLQAKK